MFLNLKVFLFPAVFFLFCFCAAENGHVQKKVFRSLEAVRNRLNGVTKSGMQKLQSSL